MICKHKLATIDSKCSGNGHISCNSSKCFKSLLQGLDTEYKKTIFFCFFLAVCLRIQINPQNKGDFLSISPERAFADFLFAHTVLHLVVMNFIGWNWCLYNWQCPSQRCVFHPQTIYHTLCFSFIQHCFIRPSDFKRTVHSWCFSVKEKVY